MMPPKTINGLEQNRLMSEGNGETQCVVFAGDYCLARRALGKYNATIVKKFPFISAYGVLINVFCLEDLKKMSCIREVCANSKVTVERLPRFFKVTAPEGAADKKTAVNSLPLHGYYDRYSTNYPVNMPLMRRLYRENKQMRRYDSPSVAFIDTGFSAPLDFYLPRKRIRAFVDFVNGEETSYDDNGHGTAVGCLIACDGRFTAGSREGTAAGADIVALKAIEQGGSGSIFRILEAMQWVYDHAPEYKIKALCMSLGGKAEEGRDPLCEASAALWKKGVTVVASAGNSGGDGVTSPGCCGRIITVGSAEQNDEGKIVRSPFSSYSEELSKPEICTDGSAVACVGVDGGKVLLSGTSISAPIITGICYDIIRANPGIAPDAVKRLLISRAEYIGEKGTGFGYIRT